MRRLSLTATLPGAFALITLLTFYFAGSYLYDNLLMQLVGIGDLGKQPQPCGDDH
jgi:hypothetical protein